MIEPVVRVDSADCNRGEQSSSQEQFEPCVLRKTSRGSSTVLNASEAGGGRAEQLRGEAPHI